MRTRLAVAVGFLLVSGLPSLQAADAVDYLRDIKPIFASHCISCHGAKVQKSGLRLDTARAALEGGNSGPVIVPGKSAESVLVQAITGTAGVSRMPPKDPRLSPEQIDRLKKWIDQGAKAPADEVAQTAVVRSNHWSFQPPQRPELPPVKHSAWVRNPIDRFILARLEKEGIRPAAEADRITLVRRVTLDLIGLPPTPEEIERALSDTSPDWFERVVDRLLSSPHYGERWGRHWLDQARYADSNGFTIDGPRSIWKYRDWVIAALNEDKPFDQFTIEQLAGDLLPNATLEQKVATGFHRNTLRNEEGGIDVEQFRVESVVDRVNTTGTVFLGLTLGCCQCHDHKFDPFSQREYYQLFAFFNNADEPTLTLATPEQVAQQKQIRGQITALEKRLKTMDFYTLQKEQSWENRLSPEQKAKLPPEVQTALEVPENGRTPEQKDVVTAAYKNFDQVRHVAGLLAQPGPLPTLAHLDVLTARRELDTRIVELKKREPRIVATLVMQERAAPRMTHVHIQGDFTRKGVAVSPGVPQVLHPLKTAPVVPGKLPNRLDLARWLVDPDNPLTARVIVNRFWQAYFGVGLVETDNDFGTQGTPPSHPELLDWLAREFQQPSGQADARPWSMKAMHRLIVTSATYRQSSRARPELSVVDPRNRLLARQNRLRLEAEIVRDVALAASGLLNPKIGGPSVFPPQPDGVYRFTQVNKNWRADLGPDRYRRGMYTWFWRSAPHPGLIVFDAPDANSTCTRRNRSNTPLQALTLLNDQAFFEFAQGLASRLLREGQPTDDERLRYAFRLCLGRPPGDFEFRRLKEFLAQQRAGFTANPAEAETLAPPNRPRDADPRELAAWVAVSRVLLNLDEFITRE